MDLRLEKVTAENWRTATFLTTDSVRRVPLDEQWIANSAVSLLKCIYDQTWNSMEKATEMPFYLWSLS